MNKMMKKGIALLTLAAVMLAGCSSAKSAPRYEGGGYKSSRNDYAGVAMYVDEEAYMESDSLEYPAEAPEPSGSEEYIRENTGKKIIYSGILLALLCCAP